MAEENQEAALRARVAELEAEIRPLRGMKQEVDKLRARAQTAESQKGAADALLQAKAKAMEDAAAATATIRQQLDAAQSLAAQRLALGQAEVPAARWGTLSTLHGAAGVDAPLDEWIAGQKAVAGSDVALLLAVSQPAGVMPPAPTPVAAPAGPTAVPPAPPTPAAAPPVAPAFNANGGVVPTPAPSNRTVESIRAEAKANPGGFLERMGLPKSAIPANLRQ